MESEQNHIIGKNLYLIRTSKKMSQRRLSMKSSVSYTTISRIEKGLTTPSIAILTNLANALNVTILNIVDNNTVKIKHQTEFNKKEFALLLLKAKGNRSINAYAIATGVSAAHISRLERELVDAPPTPETIAKLAYKAYGGISYDILMEAAGHIKKENSKCEVYNNFVWKLKEKGITEELLKENMQLYLDVAEIILKYIKK